MPHACTHIIQGVDGKPVWKAYGHERIHDYDDTVPPSEDPCWRVWAQDFYGFLKEPQGWMEIREWGEAQGHSVDVTENLVFWVEMQGRIKFDRGTLQWRLKRGKR